MARHVARSIDRRFGRCPILINENAVIKLPNPAASAMRRFR